jgi:GDPmannose 4,6-dehydratase
MGKTAFITGISGQDGSFLAELLLGKGYEVHGLIRPSTVPIENTNIGHIVDKLHLHNGDLLDSSSIDHIVREAMPDEIYNLGAITHVKKSFAMPSMTIDLNANGFVRLLESAIRHKPEARIYQASTSEIYGNSTDTFLNEDSPMHPCSPYACAKHMAFTLGNIYRDGYNMHISNGILFNHESERRGHDYVTRKITLAAARIAHGKQSSLELGNLDSKRDWGYAKEYCEAMWLMIQQDKPDNYVVATGEAHSVREFLEETFAYIGLDPYKYLVYNKELIRPQEVHYLCGDGRKAEANLNFKPQTTFKDLVRIMIEHDLEIEGK